MIAMRNLRDKQKHAKNQSMEEKFQLIPYWSERKECGEFY